MVMKYEVWHKEGKYGANGYYPGHEYKEERLGIFLQIAHGLNALGAIGAYRSEYHIFYITDDGSVREVLTDRAFLKPID